MKKILAVILSIAMLMCAAAAAESAVTRETTIMIEGTEETIVETLYESPLGYRVWYPADWFAASHEGECDFFDSVDEEANVGVSIADQQIAPEYADETLAGEVEIALANGGELVGDVREWQLESGAIVKCAELVYGDAFNPSYYICVEDKVFCVACFYPAEAAEGYGRRIEQMISTFEWMSADGEETQP